MLARLGIVTLCVAVLCAAFRVQAQPAAQDAAPHFTISGTSTVRNWSCPAEGGLTKVTPGKSAQPVPGFPSGVQTMTVTVPVKAIACEDEKMVEHLRVALKEDLHPDIAYQLVQYTLTGTDTARATGEMTIAGVTRPIGFDVKLVPSAQGLRVVGETSIDMIQFAVTPPVIFEGLLKVGKDVRVRFDAVLQP
jgi:polyisoprenoid-binding protein YceI